MSIRGERRAISVCVVLAAILTACGGSSGSTALRLEPETAQDPKVEVFLNAPTTHILADDGIDWESKREYLEYGIKTATGCRFQGRSISHPGDRIVTVELAVDRENCMSLVREGTPSEAHWKLLQLEMDTQQQKNKSKARQQPALEPQGALQKVDESAASLQDSHTYGVKYTDGSQTLVSVTLEVLNALLGAYQIF